MVIFSLIITMSFFSCIKYEVPEEPEPKPLSEILPNSVCQGYCDFRIPDTETLKDASYEGSIKIIFLKDEASITAKFRFSYQYLNNDGDWEYGEKEEVFKGNATYSYNEDDIKIKIKWDSENGEKLGGKEWIGTGKTESYSNSYSLFLKNVFGEIVTFRMGDGGYY